MTHVAFLLGFSLIMSFGIVMAYRIGLRQGRMEGEREAWRDNAKYASNWHKHSRDKKHVQ